MKTPSPNNFFPFSTIMLLLFFSFNLLYSQVGTQSRLWVMPPSQIKFPALSTPNLPVNYYSGQSANYACNGMHDENGNLLFFIVDHTVFDKNGKYISDIYLPNIPNLTVTNIFVEGTSEWLIVPVPGECKKYYLIAGGYTNNTVTAGGTPAPFYTTLDLTLPGNIDPSAQGGLTNPTAINNSTASLLTTVNSNTYPLGSIHLAVTPPLTGGNRFLFVCDNTNIFRYLVTSMGIIYDNYSTPNLFRSIAISGSICRSEMEIVKLNSGGYRLAVGYEENPLPTYCAANSIEAIYVANFNAAGVLVNDYSFPMTCSQTGAYLVKGLEFSPDGNYLYVSHTGAPYLEFINFTQSIPALAPFAGLTNPVFSTAVDFQFSQVELGNDGKIYFAGENSSGGNDRLASLDISATGGNPNGALWNDAAVIVTVPLTTAFGSSQYYQLRLLNDQIDGEIYQNFAVTSPPSECCLANNIFTRDNFTAATTATWSPGNNPFTNTIGNGNTVTIRNQLIIPAGVSITIKNMIFQFAPRSYSPFNSPGAEVIVKSSSNPNIIGGKLILDNTTFTSYNDCGLGMWEGVQVNGITASPQVPTNHISVQGWLTLVNNSVISNAYIGALAGKRITNFPNAVTHDPLYNGGVIIALNSKFLNNTQAVQFRTYTDPSNALHNNSSFSKCNFLTTINPLNDPTTTAKFGIFVYMLQTSGIIFSGNTFNNNSLLPTSPVLDMPSNGYGIFGVDANFQVVPTSPNPLVIPNTFQNLGYGIFASAVNTLNTVKIDGSLFINNYRGILLNFLSYPILTNNTFTIIKYPFLTGPGPAYGIYLNTSTNYQVEANNFAYSTDPINSLMVGNTYGIIVNNSGPTNNLIYRNTFHHIYVGCQAQRLNCKISVAAFPENNTQGLHFICNSFDASSNDNFNIVQPNGCIDYNQFSKTRTADNCFTNDGVHYDYYVNYSALTDPYTNLPHNATPILYTYTSNGSCPTKIPLTITPTVVPFDASTTANYGCPSTLPCGPPCQRVLITSNSQEIINLNNLIDGGITSTLLANIAGNMSTGNLKTVLTHSSPYLSDQVLIAYINKPNVPNGNLKDVLLANSPLRPAVLEAFNLMSSTLPNGIKNNILAAQNGISPLNGLFGQIAEATANRDYAIDGLIRDFLFDTTIVGGLDSVQLVLKAYLITNEDRCKIAAAQVAAGQLTGASSTLDTIALINNNALDNSCQLLQILIRLEQSADGCFSLRTDTSFATDVATLNQIAADTMVEGCIGAQSLLRIVFDLSFQEVVDLVPNSSNARTANPTDQSQIFIEENKIYPNPNNGTMLFSYEIPEESKGVLNFYDISGKQVSSFTLQEGQNTAQISDENLNAGIYFYQFVIEDQQISTGKFVIVK